jgi:hypothetical protein
LHLFVLCMELRSICIWNFKAILMPMSKCRRTCKVFSLWILDLLVADAASEPEESEQVSSSNSYWALKVRFYFRFSDQNALLLTDQNASLLTNQNALHVRCYKCSCFGVFCIHCMVCWFLAGLTLNILNLLIADNL